jgi:glycosyltransferase involved in cell wall biosynthesis
MSRRLRLSIVLPRLEPVTAVGTEVLARGLSHRLAARGHRVEILTTCVRDSLIWRDHYDPGVTEERGVTVRRFPVDPRRTAQRALEAGARIRRGMPVARVDQEQWLASLGSSSALRDFIARKKTHVDAFLFTPALSGTTYLGIQAAAEKSLLLPALPDLPEARIEIVAETFRRARAILASSEAEQSLLRRLYRIPPGKIRLAGLGIEPAPEYRPERFRERHGLDRPFLIFAGRRTAEKGLPRLLEYTAALVRDAGLDLRLVLMGTEVCAVPEIARDMVLDLGFLGEQDKADGLAAALALCQPSAFEGVALAPMESWLAGRPVLAEARGAVTRERCALSGGGLWYSNFFEFEEEVRLLLEREDLAHELGERGRRYAIEHGSWSRIIEGIEETCLSRSRQEGVKGA